MTPNIKGRIWYELGLLFFFFQNSPNFEPKLAQIREKKKLILVKIWLWQNAEIGMTGSIFLTELV